MLIARDRHGDQVDAVLPDRTAEAVGVALDGVLAKDDVLLCVDGDTAVIAYAKKRGIEFETIIASKGEHVHEKVLHLQASEISGAASSAAVGIMTGSAFAGWTIPITNMPINAPTALASLTLGLAAR